MKLKMFLSVYLKKNIRLKVLILCGVIAAILFVTKNYFYRAELSIPVYLIYAKGSDFSEANRNHVKKLLKLEGIEKNLFELKSVDTTIITITTTLLTRLRSTQETLYFKLALPSAYANKDLRRNIEESFSGHLRTEAFKRTVIVLDIKLLYEKGNQFYDFNQLNDDLAYIEHNFGGLGIILSDNNEVWLNKVGDALATILKAS